MASYRSQELFSVSQEYIPGGVNSPVRAFGGVGGNPLFIKRASGAYLYDEDDNKYIDYVGSWGPMILGHGHPAVVHALTEQAKLGLSFGAPTAIELEMARAICQRMPSIEQVRMVNSGTEAVMTAIRLARAFTGRKMIIKFSGGYHGHADALLVKAGSGALTFGIPNSSGIPEETTQYTLTATYNDINGVATLFRELKDKIAAVIVEPVCGNMNCVLPLPDFLENLRLLCIEHGALLIFDEVMTGFRVALGGAQSLYNVKPDLTTLGKIIGGGLPVGAVGGRRSILSLLAPEGPVYQAGTLSGNPMTMAAGLATLKEISKQGFYKTLDVRVSKLCSGIQTISRSVGVPVKTVQAGAMFGFLFTELECVANFEQVMACDHNLFKQFFHAMLQSGVYFAPSSFEAGFISMAHSDEIIDETLSAFEHGLKKIKNHC